MPHSNTNTALDEFEPKNNIEAMAKRVAKWDNISIAEGHELLARQYETNGELQLAEREYRALVAFKPHSALPYLKLSELLVKAETVDKVPELINQSLIFDESALAFILLGEAYNALGRYSDAIEAFQHAQDLGAQRNDPHILVGLSYAYRASGQVEKAREVESQRAQAKATPEGAQRIPEIEQLLQHADVLIQRQRYDDALSELRTSLSIRETGDAHMRIGQIYLQKQEFDQAVVHLEKARQMLPKDPLLLYNLSIALVQQQEYQRAWDILEELQQMDAQFGDPYELRTKLEPYVQK